MRISKLYSKAFLLGDLRRAALTMSRDEFVRFQVDAINKSLPNFAADFLTVNRLHLNKKSLLDGEIISAVAYNSRNAIENYQRYLEFDTFTPITFLNPGTAIFNTSYRHMDDWMDQPIYKNHCTLFDMYWVLGVSYRFPHYKTTFVAFHYMRAKGLGFSNELFEESVEYVSYPFYLAWLYLFGAICPETLDDWLQLCVGISEPRFRVLRAIAGSGQTNFRQLADQAGLIEGTVHRHVENAYEALVCLKPELHKLHPGKKRANRLVDLGKNFRFFEFGAGNIERILPRRRFHLHGCH